MAVEDRAERLRVMLSASPWMPDVNAAVADLPVEELAKLDGIDDSDVELACACYAAERELRERGFDALERLAAALATAEVEPGADVDERVAALPDDALGDLGRAAYELGWLRDPR